MVLVGSGHFRTTPEAFAEVADARRKRGPNITLNYNRARFQLAATLRMSEILGEPGQPLPVIAQEYTYAPIEKDYLRTKLGITVVGDPDAFSLIDEHTLLVFCSVPHYFAYEVSRRKLPAAMVTDHPTFDGAVSNFPFSSTSLKPFLGKIEVDHHYANPLQYPDSYFNSEMTTPVVEMFRHYNKVEIHQLDLKNIDPPNHAFIHHQCLWVKKGESEELRPLGCIPPIGFRVIREDEDSIRYEPIEGDSPELENRNKNSV